MDSETQALMSTHVYIPNKPTVDSTSKQSELFHENMKNLIAQWRGNQQFKQIHEVTLEKVQMRSLDNTSWLHIAVEIEDDKTVKSNRAYCRYKIKDD